MRLLSNNITRECWRPRFLCVGQVEDAPWRDAQPPAGALRGRMQLILPMGMVMRALKWGRDTRRWLPCC